jgi:AraC-like DNA-binding protein
MLVFDSDRFSPRERIEAYEDFFAGRLSQMRVLPAGDDPFRVKADIKTVHDMPMVRLNGSGYRTERTSYEVARQRNHFHVAVFHLNGTPLLESRAGTFQVRPGDVSILSSMNTARYGIQSRFDHIIIPLPQRFPWTEVVVPEKVVPASNPMRSIVFELVASVYAQADRLSPAAAAMLANNIAELMFAMCCEEPLHISTSTSLRAAMFDRASRIIASRAHDPDLHASGVARQLGVSMRLLQRIFQENGATVAQRITTSRIEKSSTMLVDERMSTWTITQIAFACGFGDLTTFERSFSALNGMTPTAWRRLLPGTDRARQDANADRLAFARSQIG